VLTTACVIGGFAGVTVHTDCVAVVVSAAVVVVDVAVVVVVVFRFLLFVK
jgi:hypothetical protein